MQRTQMIMVVVGWCRDGGYSGWYDGGDSDSAMALMHNTLLCQKWSQHATKTCPPMLVMTSDPKKGLHQVIHKVSCDVASARDLTTHTDTHH